MIKVHLGKTLLRPFYDNFQSSHDGSSVSHLGDVFLPGFPPTHLILLITALLPKASGLGNLTSHSLLPPNHHSLHPQPGFTVAVNILFHNYGSIFPAGFLTFDAPGLFLTHLHFLVSVPHPPGRDDPLYTACLSALASSPVLQSFYTSFDRKDTPLPHSRPNTQAALL